MKKFILFGVIFLIFPVMVVQANDISSINMDIYVDNNGNALINEVWEADVTSGTEGWHPYYNLGNSEIVLVGASMDGVEFTTVSDWDINNSFSDKAYKTSLYYPSSDEVDVVFGISSYGSHEYEISYKITNFVSSVEDADMIYWNLFPYDFSAEPSNVNIIIHSDFNYSDIEFYGYGKGGANLALRDGKIYIDSNGSVSTSEYITVLVRFPKGTFNINNSLENDFSYYYDMAEDGAVNYNSNSDNVFVIVLSSLIIGLIWGIIIVIFIIYIFSKIPKYRYGKLGNKVKKDVPNYREIPCSGNIYLAYWVGVQYNIIFKKENLLGSILLKWLRDGNIKIEKIEKKGVIKEKIESNVIFVKQPVEENELENKLYQMMFEASGDGKLESNEFKKWCSKNYSKILKWFDDVLEFERKMLVNEGKVIESKEKKFKFLTYTYYDVDDSMMEEAEKLFGLKKFLDEFTLIDKREPIEVQLWNEYLIYAQLFGIADEVAKQFKKLYPDIIENMDYMGIDCDDILFINMVCYNGMRSAKAAQSSASSSSGGGGGSFGGGGGGGGFR